MPLLPLVPSQTECAINRQGEQNIVTGRKQLFSAASSGTVCRGRDRQTPHWPPGASRRRVPLRVYPTEAKRGRQKVPTNVSQLGKWKHFCTMRRASAAGSVAARYPPQSPQSDATLNVMPMVTQCVTQALRRNCGWGTAAGPTEADVVLSKPAR